MEFIIGIIYIIGIMTGLLLLIAIPDMVESFRADCIKT